MTGIVSYSKRYCKKIIIKTIKQKQNFSVHRSSPNRSGQIQRDDNKRRCSAKTAVVSTSKLFQHNCPARVELQRSSKLKFCRAFTTFRIAFTTFVALLLNLESCSYLSAWFFFFLSRRF